MLAIPAEGWVLYVGALEGVFGPDLLLIVGGWDWLGALVVAGLGFDVASFEDIAFFSVEEIFVAVGRPHVVNSLSSQLH